MHPNLGFYVKIILGLFVLFFYCEYLVYYAVLRKCHWPNVDPHSEDHAIDKTAYNPVKIMVLTDTHLFGSKNGYWFDKLRREWQMYRAFQTATALHQPELVFVLGDLTDEGSLCSTAEFDDYAKRFYSLFAVPETTKMYVLVGNHDIGFHYSISPSSNQRFVSGFNASVVQLVSVRGNHFVLVNSMALEGDDCFLCKTAEEELAKIEKILECTKGSLDCDLRLKLDIYSRPILMQHFPLYRKSDMECADFDAAPNPTKQERFREKWECLSAEATFQLLNHVKPRLALSGHTHHGCTRPLAVGDGIEITLPSFNWRNKPNPNYGLGVFTPNNYAFIKCEMPREYTVIAVYIIGGLLLSWFMYKHKVRRRATFL